MTEEAHLDMTMIGEDLLRDMIMIGEDRLQDMIMIDAGHLPATTIIMIGEDLLLATGEVHLTTMLTIEALLK